MCISHRKELNHLPSMNIATRIEILSIVICRSFWNHTRVNRNVELRIILFYYKLYNLAEDVKKITKKTLHVAIERTNEMISVWKMMRCFADVAVGREFHRFIDIAGKLSLFFCSRNVYSHCNCVVKYFPFVC